MALPLVILTHPLPVDWISSLQGRVRLLVGPADPPGFAPHLLEQMDEAVGILCFLSDKVDQALIDSAPRLKIVSNMAGGVDNVNLAACTRRGIPVGNTPDVVTDATADLALALLLSTARLLPAASRDAKDGLWKTWSPTQWLGADLRGATLGLVGMGKIGQAVAERARGFGMKILYTNSRQHPTLDSSSAATYCSLDQLLAESDFVSLHCPLTPQTRGLLDKAALKRMKPTAILINTSRGQVVSQDALIEALQQGWIAGAALDVTDPEPLPVDNPLYSLPNCLVVPHIGSATHGTRRRMAEMACDNLLAGLAGQRLPYLVNQDVLGK